MTKPYFLFGLNYIERRIHALPPQSEDGIPVVLCSVRTHCLDHDHSLSLFGVLWGIKLYAKQASYPELGLNFYHSHF